MNPAASDERWSGLEMQMLATVDVFRHKPGIMKKAEGFLAALKLALVEDLARETHPLPEGIDIRKGQIARGENHNGFPFISLDMPQLFNKNTFFTYRTLFWWGHYLGFSLILKGAPMERAVGRLTGESAAREAGNLLVGLAPTPWEWELHPDHFVPLEACGAERLRRHAETHQYLKLLRCISVTDPSFAHLDWTRTGVDTFRDMVARVCG